MASRPPGTFDWAVTLGPLPDGVYSVHVRAFDLANYPDGPFSMAIVLYLGGKLTIFQIDLPLEIL
jgi:hypothetical protein